jgi:hypothetical protein
VQCGLSFRRAVEIQICQRQAQTGFRQGGLVCQRYLPQRQRFQSLSSLPGGRCQSCLCHATVALAGQGSVEGIDRRQPVTLGKVHLADGQQGIRVVWGKTSYPLVDFNSGGV